MIIVLGPGTAGAQPIFVIGDSTALQLFNGIKAMNRLGNMLNAIAPASFKNDGFGASEWRKRFTFTSLTAGSITTGVQVNAGSNTNTNTASTTMTNALANTPLDGVSYVSSTITGVGQPSSTSSDSSSTNLGLILGLSIPLGILRTF